MQPNERIRVTLTDARQFNGRLVIESPSAIDVVWTEGGVGMQASIPRSLIAKIETFEDGGS